jgi:hypothetical protein
VSETGPGAAAGLTAVPLFQALQIEDECFRTALRTWLGLRIPWWPASGYASAARSLRPEVATAVLKQGLFFSELSFNME